MGASCCKLMHLFCCPPCLSSIVTKLAFNPPNPTYCAIKTGPDEEKLVLNNESYGLLSSNAKYIDYHSIMINDNDVIACVHLCTARWTKDTILMSHGNAVDIGMVLGTLIEMGLKLKVNIVTYDYSGYGLSSGQPSERNLYEGIVTVLDYVRHNLDIPAKNIIVYGQSIGSVPATFLASRYKFGLLVLHSPIASGCRLIQGCCCTQGCCDVLNNVGMADKIKCPTLVIHGTDDSVIPVEHSYHILRLIPQQLVLDPLFIHGANHNDCEMYPEYLERLRAVFVNDLPRFQHGFSDSLYLS